ncbi:hypothetical protein ACO0SA_002370 [Hanseniaspora valbyensis]
MSELENNGLDAVEDSLKKFSSTTEQTSKSNDNVESGNAFVNANEEDGEEGENIEGTNDAIDSINKESNGSAGSTNAATALDAPALGAAETTPAAAKTPDRRKIAIKFIQNKTKRHVTFSKRKHGIMKKAYELSVLTGTQVLLLVVSETGLVYTFTTPKFQPIVTEPEGKNLIQTCLNTPDGEEEEEEEDEEEEEGEGEEDEGNDNNNGNSDGAEGEENDVEEHEEEDQQQQQQQSEEAEEKNNNNNNQQEQQFEENSNNNQYQNQNNANSNEQFNANIADDLVLDTNDEIHQNKRMKLNDGSFTHQTNNAETLIV